MMSHMDRLFRPLARFDFAGLSIPRTIALAIPLTILLASTAHAQMATRGQGGVGWCAIQARLVVKSFSLIIDKSRGDGYGRIVCDYADGSEEILPIRIKTKGLGVGVNFPNVYQESTAKMFASGFGIAGGGAQALIGTYITGKAGVRFVNVGGDVGLNMTANRHGFSIPLSLQTENARRREEAVGFGIGAGYMQISIDPNNTQAKHLRHLPLRHPIVRAIPLPPPRPRPLVPVAPLAPAVAPIPVANPALEIQGASEGQIGAANALDEPTPEMPVAQTN